MKGCRPLTDSEIKAVCESFGGVYRLRDRALFILGIYTGRRISQLLSLRIDDILGVNNSIMDRIWWRRNSVKGKREGQVTVLHPKAQEALAAWLEYRQENDISADNSFVFCSRKGTKAMGRVQAHRILKEVYEAAGLDGKVATHTMRKTFASRMYQALDHDLQKLQSALGHANIQNTLKYLSFDQGDIDAAVLAL